MHHVFNNTIEKKSINQVPVSKSNLVVFQIEPDENSIIQDLPKLLCINNTFLLNF